MQRGDPPTRGSPSGLLLLLLLAWGCASAGPAEGLDRLYRPGEARSEGAKRTPRQQNELVSTRMLDRRADDLGLGPELRQALGPAVAEAVGYDAYRARVKRGQGYSASWKTYCDYVFFDDSQRIVGAHRRQGGC